MKDEAADEWDGWSPVVERGAAYRCLSRLEESLKPLMPLLLLLAYSFLGAAMFHLTEQPHELELADRRRLRLDKLELDAAKDMVQVYEELPGAGYQHERMTRAWHIVDRLRADLGVADANSTLQTTQWNFWGALFYCVTLHTTIGYGNIAPKTRTGRTLTMLYSIVGIPLCLLALVRLGRLFAAVCQFLWSAIKRCRCRPGHRPPATMLNVDKDLLDFPVWLLITITVLWMLLCAFLFTLFEQDWKFFDSLYFTVISFTTIGLGDVLPERTKFMLSAGLLILIGLTLVSACVNLIMNKIDAVNNAIKAEIDNQYRTAMVDGAEFEGVGMVRDDEGRLENTMSKILYHMPIGCGALYRFVMTDKSKQLLKQHYRRRAAMESKSCQTDDYLLSSLRLKWAQWDVKSHDDINSLVAFCDYRTK